VVDVFVRREKGKERDGRYGKVSRSRLESDVNGVYESVRVSRSTDLGTT